jgi:hypothetical protein
MNDRNRYGIMVLCKVMGLHWRVVQDVILTSQRSADAVQPENDELYGDYNAISPSLAHRLLRFWQTQQ